MYVCLVLQIWSGKHGETTQMYASNLANVALTIAHGVKIVYQPRIIQPMLRNTVFYGPMKFITRFTVTFQTFFQS